MTATAFSLVLSEPFAALLIWVGCTSVICMVEEKSGVQPATTIGYHPTEAMVGNTTYGEPTVSFACGNTSHNCVHYCAFCNPHYGVPIMECLSQLLYHECLASYEDVMAAKNSTDWCKWGNMSGLYSNLSLCTEEISDCLLIPWPNPLVEGIFVDIHARYFMDCPTEELRDPPPVIVFALVITPICLIPIMVSLVVLKTKNGDGSS